MTQRLVARISSKDITRESKYLYGSSIYQEADEFVFLNPRIAPGKTVLSWYSQTQYQAVRRSPDLPLLVAGKSYRIKITAETQPEHRFYLQLIFYNRQQEKIEQIPIRKQEDSFVCPEDTYTYEIKLMTAGCKELRFHCLELWTDEVANNLSQIRDRSNAYFQGQVPNELALVKDLLTIRKD